MPISYHTACSSKIGYKLQISLNISGVRLAKTDLSSVFGSAKKLWFSVVFQCYKINCSLGVFRSVCCLCTLRVLSNLLFYGTTVKTTYFHAQLVHRPQTIQFCFWKPNCRNCFFGCWILWSLQSGSVFRKLISDISWNVLNHTATNHRHICIYNSHFCTLYTLTYITSMHIQQAYGPILSRVLSHLCQKNISTTPEKNCYANLQNCFARLTPPNNC